MYLFFHISTHWIFQSQENPTSEYSGTCLCITGHPKMVEWNLTYPAATINSKHHCQQAHKSLSKWLSLKFQSATVDLHQYWIQILHTKINVIFLKTHQNWHLKLRVATCHCYLPTTPPPYSYCGFKLVHPPHFSVYHKFQHRVEALWDASTVSGTIAKVRCAKFQVYAVLGVSWWYWHTGALL